MAKSAGSRPQPSQTLPSTPLSTQMDDRSRCQEGFLPSAAHSPYLRIGLPTGLQVIIGLQVILHFFIKHPFLPLFYLYST